KTPRVTATSHRFLNRQLTNRKLPTAITHRFFLRSSSLSFVSPTRIKMAVSLSSPFCSKTILHRNFPASSSSTQLLHFSPPSHRRGISQSVELSLRRRDQIATVSAISGSPGVGSSSSVGQDTTTPNSLDSVKVVDLSGEELPISDLWKDRKVVVAFARHFGCVLCRKRADYLAAKKDVMDAAGVTLVLIGPGSVDQARTFFEQTKFQGEVYADPNHSAYEALNFVSGVGTTFTPKAGLKIMQLYMEGYRQDWKLSSESNTVSRGGWQQGGIIVAGPGKTNISYIHRVSKLLSYTSFSVLYLESGSAVYVRFLLANDSSSCS
ncbi:Thioredoxin-like protein AAED1, chloroplastic, partial [Linum perenne]